MRHSSSSKGSLASLFGGQNGSSGTTPNWGQFVCLTPSGSASDLHSFAGRSILAAQLRKQQNSVRSDSSQRLASAGLMNKDLSFSDCIGFRPNGSPRRGHKQSPSLVIEDRLRSPRSAPEVSNGYTNAHRPLHQNLLEKSPKPMPHSPEFPPQQRQFLAQPAHKAALTSSKDVPTELNASRRALTEPLRFEQPSGRPALFIALRLLSIVVVACFMCFSWVVIYRTYVHRTAGIVLTKGALFFSMETSLAACLWYLMFGNTHLEHIFARASWPRHCCPGHDNGHDASRHGEHSRNSRPPQQEEFRKQSYLAKLLGLWNALVFTTLLVLWASGNLDAMMTSVTEIHQSQWIGFGILAILADVPAACLLVYALFASASCATLQQDISMRRGDSH